MSSIQLKILQSVLRLCVSRLNAVEVVRHDGPLSIRRGFTVDEVGKLAAEAGLDYARVEKLFGYHFSLSGERGLAMAPKLAPAPGLA